MRSSLQRARPRPARAEKRCERNAGRDGEEERRGEKLCYEFTIARHTILLPFSFSSSSHFLLFSSLSLLRNVLQSASHSRSLFRVTFYFSFSSLLSPALLSSIYVSPACSKLFYLCAIHSTRAYRIAINGFRFRCLNLCILLAFRSIRSFLHWPSLFSLVLLQWHLHLPFRRPSRLESSSLRLTNLLKGRSVSESIITRS